MNLLILDLKMDSTIFSSIPSFTSLYKLDHITFKNSKTQLTQHEYHPILLNTQYWDCLITHCIFKSFL